MRELESGGTRWVCEGRAVIFTPCMAKIRPALGVRDGPESVSAVRRNWCPRCPGTNNEPVLSDPRDDRAAGFGSEIGTGFPRASGSYGGG